MTPYQIILTVIISVLLTYLMVLVMRRNARRAIAKREEEFRKRRMMFTPTSAIPRPDYPSFNPRMRKRKEETERIRKKYPLYPTDAEERKKRYDDDVPPIAPIPEDYYISDFHPNPHHDNTPSPDHSDHGGGGSFGGGGSSDSWGDSSSDSSSSDGGGGDD